MRCCLLRARLPSRRRFRYPKLRMQWNLTRPISECGLLAPIPPSAFFPQTALSSAAMSRRYFGLGDKAGPLDHRNQAFTMWNSDVYGWQESTDPLYKSIPFLLALRHGVSYGMLFDNTYRQHWQFGKGAPDEYSFGAEGGDLD